MRLCWSKGCKITICPALRMIPSSKAICAWCTLGRAADFFFKLPFLTACNCLDLQRPTVQCLYLWKDLRLYKNIFSTFKTGRMFKRSFGISKWPHLHKVYNLHSVAYVNLCSPLYAILTSDVEWRSTTHLKVFKKNQQKVWSPLVWVNQSSQPFGSKVTKYSL